MNMVCIKCQTNQPVCEFLLRKDTGKRRSVCRTCRSAQNAKWKDKNRDHVRSSNLNWQKQNREKCRASSLAWAKRNKQKISHNTVAYNARKAKAQPSWLSAIQLAQVAEMYDVALAKTVQTGIVHHVDHIYPLKGLEGCGLHVPWNLQVIPASENISKGNRVAVPETGPLT
jgi:hypothetical protein